MKGFLLIILTYAITLGFLSVFKLIISKRNKNKKSSETTTPKIYYVTRQKPQSKKTQNAIPIQATVVEKEKVRN